MKTSDLFIKALEAEAVEYVFGIPGEESLDFLESLRGSSIRLVLTRHEQAAGIMAATYGRLTGKVGVCLSTLGPGATNLVTAAAYAQLGAMPMLMITGQKPVKASKQGRFQVIDVVDMMQPLTKYAVQVVSGDRVPAIVREACRLAQQERPGAVHVELPEDIAAESTSAALIPASLSRRPVAEQKSITLAVETLEAARSPLLLIGAGANRKMTSRMLHALVQKTGIPYVSTQMGKGVLDENEDLYIGSTALSAGDFVHRAIEAADLIINVGHDVVEKPPFLMRDNGQTVIHINFDSATVDPVYFPQVEIVGDIANSIWQLMEAVSPQPTWDFSFFWRAREAQIEHRLMSEQDDRFPLLPERLVCHVRAALPDDGMVTLDNGMYKLWFARNFPAVSRNSLLLDNALATMGAGLPSAIAAKLVHPERAVLSVCGDGGFMMSSQEIETAVRLKLHLVVLILRDDAYGMIKWKQQKMQFADYGLDYGNPDFVQLAESYGARGWRVTADSDCIPTIEKCLAEQAVHVVDVPMDYSLNHQMLNQEIQRLSEQI